MQRKARQLSFVSEGLTMKSRGWLVADEEFYEIIVMTAGLTGMAARSFFSLPSPLPLEREDWRFSLKVKLPPTKHYNT
jgi:hypothetical protein